MSHTTGYQFLIDLWNGCEILWDEMHELQVELNCNINECNINLEKGQESRLTFYRGFT